MVKISIHISEYDVGGPCNLRLITASLVQALFLVTFLHTSKNKSLATAG